MVMMKASRAYASFMGKTEVDLDDIKKIASFVYMHRMRRLPF